MKKVSGNFNHINTTLLTQKKIMVLTRSQKATQAIVSNLCDDIKREIYNKYKEVWCFKHWKQIEDLITKGKYDPNVCSEGIWKRKQRNWLYHIPLRELRSSCHFPIAIYFTFIAAYNRYSRYMQKYQRKQIYKTFKKLLSQNSCWSVIPRAQDTKIVFHYRSQGRHVYQRPFL
jgi:hypothetical protein